MCEFNLNEPKNVYFIGIGGISMSGLAELLLSRHFAVSGSDMKRSPLTERLESLGAVISYDQSVSHITDDTDLVVYTAAVHDGNPDLDDAKKRGITVLSRAELLGLVMKTYIYGLRSSDRDQYLLCRFIRYVKSPVQIIAYLFTQIHETGI